MTGQQRPAAQSFGFCQILAWLKANCAAGSSAGNSSEGSWYFPSGNTGFQGGFQGMI